MIATTLSAITHLASAVGASAATIVATLAAAPAGYGWRPFLTPLPVWDYWFWLLLPLALGVAVAYKSTKCHEARTIPTEAAVLAGWIVGGLIAAATAVALVARWN